MLVNEAGFSEICGLCIESATPMLIIVNNEDFLVTCTLPWYGTLLKVNAASFHLRISAL